jgi:hypothetical protein
VVNYLEKFICIEILEKITRMQRYLRSEPDALRGQGTEVVNIFLKALDAIIGNLGPIIERLSFRKFQREEVILDEWERLSTVRQLSDIFKSIDTLHLHLHFTYGIWVKPETHVFLDNVLKIIPLTHLNKDKVNVILSNLYSFLETDLSDYVEYVLSPMNVHVQFQNESPSVFLPKIERDNPLNWAILVHECGHIEPQGASTLLSQPEIIPPQADPLVKKILKNWVEEIYSDLLACQIIGPAYLASFATIAILLAGAGGSEKATETHPADIIRISIIKEVLKNKNLIVELITPKLSCNDLSSLFFNLLEERTKLDRKYFPASLDQPKVQLKFGEFVDVICEKVNEVPLNHHLTKKDFSRVECLAKRLSEGIPIGAYHNPQLIQSAKTKFSKGSINSAELDEAKNAIQESRVFLWEIVNAGWIYKVEYFYPNAFSLIFDISDQPIEEKMANWSIEIEGLDRLLLKSIESAEIQRLMEEV